MVERRKAAQNRGFLSTASNSERDSHAIWDASLYAEGMQPNVPAPLLPALNRYLELLERWNKIHALTALPIEARFEELILDSAALLPFLEPLPPGSRVVDFGTGMGVPAIVLACARPDIEVLALDKSHKKLAFLKQAALELGQNNLIPIAGRAEELPSLKAAMGTAKAVGTAELLISWWERHALPGAPLMLLKGPEWNKETLPPGWTGHAHPYELPTKGQRCVLVLEQTLQKAR